MSYSTPDDMVACGLVKKSWSSMENHCTQNLSFYNIHMSFWNRIFNNIEVTFEKQF